MKQILHLLQRDNPAPGHAAFCVRRPRNECSGRYNPDEMFYPDVESSQLLEYLMPVPFIRYTLDNMELAQEVNYNGFEFKNPEHLDWAGGLNKWETLSGTVGSKVSHYLVPRGTKLGGPGDNLRKLGLITDASSKKLQTSVQKRMRRAFAHHESSSIWNPVSLKDQVLTIRTPKGITQECYIGQETPENNGMHFCTPMFWSLVTQRPMCQIREGAIYKITGLMPKPLGMVKGHVFIKDGLRYGAIFNGTKPELALENRVFLGDLGRAKTGDAYSDVQAIINFSLEELLMKDLKFYNHEVFEACQDDRKLLRMCSRMGAAEIDRENADFDPEQEWLMTMIRRYGVSHRFDPGLFKRFYETALHKVLDMGSRKMRIPMWRHARRGYLMPEVLAFDSYGRVDWTQTKLGNNVCIPFLKEGPVVMYRQPQGNPNEHIVANNVHIEEYLDLGYGDVIFLGLVMAEYALHTMGGGDYDDPVIVTDDPEWVEHFRALPAYPTC